MTLAIAPRSGPALADDVPRYVMPSPLQTDDSVVAYEFLTLKDSCGSDHDLVLGEGAHLLRGALAFATGATAYAICSGLLLPANFTKVTSVFLGDNTGAIWGNYSATNVGARLYSSAGAIMFKFGDDAGRAVLPVTPTGWLDLGVSADADGHILLCTKDAAVGSTDASARGEGVCRYGSQEASGVTAAGGSTIVEGGLYDRVMTVDEMRAQLVIAEAQRLSKGFGEI